MSGELHFVKQTFHAMGSPCTVHLYVSQPHQADALCNTVIAEVTRLEKKYSRYRDDSITYIINEAARQGSQIEVDEETASLLDYADTLWQQSEGLFDITSGVLRSAWNFKSGNIPEQAQLDTLLPRIGWHKIEWQRPVLRFTQPGMELDFGGYVKEYAADCAAAVATQQGIQHGLVELGGDLRVIGAHPDGRPWQIGVRHPRIANRVLAHIELASGAVASSGDYERCILANGKRYGHVLNPFSGWPISGLVAVSTQADHCLLAGSASTIALLKGEQGIGWLEQLGLPWLAIDEQGTVHHAPAYDPLHPGPDDSGSDQPARLRNDRH